MLGSTFPEASADVILYPGKLLKWAVAEQEES